MGIVGQAAEKEKRRRRLRMSMGKFMDNQGRVEPKDYPECAASLKECPPAIEDPKSPPSSCKFCPRFLESSYNKKDEESEKKRAKELAELFSNMGKKSQIESQK